MPLSHASKGHGFRVSIISQAVWRYHRFNDSYRDIQEEFAYRGIIVSHESIRSWRVKFGRFFKEVIKKRERKPGDKWHLDEMAIKLNGVSFILWRAVDAQGYELDVFLQRRRNKKSAIRFLSRLSGDHHVPRIIVRDKLKSYVKPIRDMMPYSQYCSHKSLNNRAENAHQPTRRKEKCLIKFKSPQGRLCA
jgi:Transposase and inactivated derivatives